MEFLKKSYENLKAQRSLHEMLKSWSKNFIGVFDKSLM